MRILPVLDLMNGVVVRGVGGRRSEYQPVQSRLVASAEPIAVAEAFRSHFGLTELYVADLDAIGGRPPSLPIYDDLLRRGFRLWIDAGVRDRTEADALAASGVGLVLGLETLAGPAALADILARHQGTAVFSLDLRAGVPLGERTSWGGADAWEIAGRAVELGARRLLILDLVRVGVGEGTGTEALCARLTAAYPDVEVWAGGGVRHAADLRHLQRAGVRAVLVASALHDGTLSREEISHELASSQRTPLR